VHRNAGERERGFSKRIEIQVGKTINNAGDKSHQQENGVRLAAGNVDHA
jgi:hypothetical protein